MSDSGHSMHFLSLRKILVMHNSKWCFRNLFNRGCSDYNFLILLNSWGKPLSCPICQDMFQESSLWTSFIHILFFLFRAPLVDTPERFLVLIHKIFHSWRNGRSVQYMVLQFKIRSLKYSCFSTKKWILFQRALTMKN